MVVSESRGIELIRPIGKWGNSAGILLPREWVGKEARIILLDRSSDIKKEVLNILEPYLEDILGVYLVGSYARGEQEENSDIDILAISKNLNKHISSAKYDISIVKIESIENAIKTNPILIASRIMEAKAIFNSSLLDELKKHKYLKNKFRNFFEEVGRILDINRGLIEIDKENRKEFAEPSVIYSLVLRLRGLYLIKCILKNRIGRKDEFLDYLNKKVGAEYKKVYNLYSSVKINTRSREKVKLESAEVLLNLLAEEVRKFS